MILLKSSSTTPEQLTNLYQGLLVIIYTSTDKRKSLFRAQATGAAMTVPLFDKIANKFE